MKVGITADHWKSKTFERILSSENIEFERRDDPSFTVFIVETNNPSRLKKIVDRCQKECRKVKR